MKHKARVVKIGSDSLTVALDAEATGCSSCALAGGCCSGGTAGRIPSGKIRVSAPGSRHKYNIGDVVTIETDGHTMGRAIVLGLVMPLAILVGCAVGGSLLFPGEADSTLGAAVGLVGIALYFILLRLLRQPVERRLRWRIAEP